jgi:hypothetical protein
MTLPQTIVANLTTKADKIRTLDRSGMSRAEIARFLGISYQHVRNTLVPATSRTRSSPIATADPQPIKPWPAQRLIDAGFILIGECSAAGAGAFSYSDRAPAVAGVYAFAVDGVVKYVGLTRGTLRTRLGQYVYGHPGQRTSARVKGLILDALARGRRVQVLAAQPPSSEWNGLPIDGAAGLEIGLIQTIKPEWNQHGSR